MQVVFIRKDIKYMAYSKKIIRIFPNHASANRLIGAVLIDLDDEWLSSTRKYIKFGK